MEQKNNRKEEFKVLSKKEFDEQLERQVKDLREMFDKYGKKEKKEDEEER